MGEHGGGGRVRARVGRGAVHGIVPPATLCADVRMQPRMQLLLCCAGVRVVRGRKRMRMGCQPFAGFAHGKGGGDWW